MRGVEGWTYRSLLSSPVVIPTSTYIRACNTYFYKIKLLFLEHKDLENSTLIALWCLPFLCFFRIVRIQIALQNLNGLVNLIFDSLYSMLKTVKTYVKK